MRTCAPDQRIKVFFPTSDGRAPALPLDENWLKAYQALPDQSRPPRRSYTIRSLRENEVDIDFVLHGVSGPASAWATQAQPGQHIQIAAPNALFPGDPGGYEWRPPKAVKRVLLIADETAVPALAGILEELAASRNRPETHAYIEIPSTDDRYKVERFPELSLNWYPRGVNMDVGAAMIKAARSVDLPIAPLSPTIGELPEINVDTDILWESADADDGAFYAWVAGEAGAVKTVRKILIADRGIARKTANLMGYWRKGQVRD